MDGSKIESGLQLFSRLNQRPSLENINPVLFCNGPFPNEFVEITGNSGSGKTLLMMDLLARCLLPMQCDGIDLPGKNCGAVLIDTDHHFSIFKLAQIMKSIVKKCWDESVELSEENLENVVKSSLSNLLILNCYDSNQLEVTFYNLDRILSENLNISLIAIDSISSFYWEYRSDNGMIGLQSYHMKILGSLESIIKNSHVVVVFTQSDAEVKSSKDVYAEVAYRIILKEQENVFQARIINKDAQKTVRFVIEDSINFVDDD